MANASQTARTVIKQRVAAVLGPVEARAGEVFDKNPGMRDDYAKQQFVHALLRSQMDQRDRVGRGKRRNGARSSTNQRREGKS